MILLANLIILSVYATRTIQTQQAKRQLPSTQCTQPYNVSEEETVRREQPYNVSEEETVRREQQYTVYSTLQRFRRRNGSQRTTVCSDESEHFGED